MGIETTIMEEIHRLHCQDRKPKCLYLGCEDMIEFKQELFQKCKGLPETSQSTRLEFNGLKIYKVDAERHFNII